MSSKNHKLTEVEIETSFVTHKFSEDVLEFLSLLLEEYLRVKKLNKAQ
jgi:hypothetical protein